MKVPLSPPAAGLAAVTGAEAPVNARCPALLSASFDGLQVWSTRVLPGRAPMSFIGTGILCAGTVAVDGKARVVSVWGAAVLAKEPEVGNALCACWRDTWGTVVLLGSCGVPLYLKLLCCAASFCNVFAACACHPLLASSKLFAPANPRPYSESKLAFSNSSKLRPFILAPAAQLSVCQARRMSTQVQKASYTSGASLEPKWLRTDGAEDQGRRL
mmetsp:Transcript_11695/g.16723  ORF Transcript_11695/g.16723 Transcript_11695/m.16723 type:complete len:215 (-) Transcript_11695:231-875(-)